MQGNRYTPAMLAVVSLVWTASLLALAALWWRRRPFTVLDLWLSVVMCAWLFDIALSAVLNGGRFDLGFYAGRVYGLLAANFVLTRLVLENSVLHAELLTPAMIDRMKRLGMGVMIQARQLIIGSQGEGGQCRHGLAQPSRITKDVREVGAEVLQKTDLFLRIQSAQHTV